MKKDPFSLFIEDSVDYSKMQYSKLMLTTKKQFFNYLLNEKPTKEFSELSSEIWNKVDHKYMDERIKELEEMIEARDLEDRPILNEDAEYQEIYGLEDISKFKKVENKYKEMINNYYDKRLKTIKKGYVDKISYLSKLVNSYEDVQSIIPYFNKDGTVRCYQNITTYLSMLFNTNLNRSGWNRTYYDANLLGEDLMYLPAHPFACPLCMEWQGKVYSKSGKNKNYPKMQIAIDGGVGHPNCKHQWLIYWGKEMMQEDKYNSPEWEEKYKTKQKLQSLQLERTRLKTDRDIYKNIGNYDEVDKINSKIKKINSKIKELK